MCDALGAVAYELGRRYRDTGQFSATQGLSTGLESLDQFTRGFHPGDFFVIAGRPSMGQLPLAYHMALANAASDQPTLIIDDDNPESVMMKLLSARTRVTLNQITGRKIDQGNCDRLNRALTDFENLPLFVCCRPTFSSEELLQIIRSQARSRRVKLVVLTALSLLRVREFGWEQGGRLQDGLRLLRAVAQENELAVIVVSDISRRVEERSDHRPRLNDIIQVEAIQSVADVILSLYRDEIYDLDSEDKNRVECHVLFNQKGVRGMTTLPFDPLCGAFC